MTECSICLEYSGCQKIKLECGHEFHLECISKITNNSCPLCRRKIINKKICMGNHITFFNNNFYKKDGTCSFCMLKSLKGYLLEKI